jgi:ApeA N-terminal domain 1
MEIELIGLEEWLRLGSITGTRSRTKISATYKGTKDINYIVNDGAIAIRYDVLGPYQGTYRCATLELKEFVSLIYRPKKALSVDGLGTKFGLLQELFVLLTDSEYALTWPSIKINTGGKSHSYALYFWKLKTSDKPPAYYECPTNFLQLRDNFGDIFSEWQKKREQFGPGFYLYLGVRRGVKLYIEHRFVNLIWGLEALHRRKPVAATAVEPRVKEKVRRILSQIVLKKDRKWLDRHLELAQEPTLEQRMFDVITTVPIGLEHNRIRRFAKRCADLRNAVSHFGAQRHGGTYQQFLQELLKASDALSVIYHMLILHEIGIEQKLLNAWIYEGFRSYPNKRYLVAADLLDPGVLNPPPFHETGQTA